MTSPFELLQQPIAFDVDQTALDTAYQRGILAAHPDNFLHDPQQQRFAMQTTVALNDAYKILNTPVARGKVVLEHHFGALPQHHTTHDMDILTNQLELREFAETNDAAVVHQRIDADIATVTERIRSCFAATPIECAATLSALEHLQFLTRFQQQLNRSTELI